MLLTVLVVVGFLLCHNSLNTNQASQELWKMALRSGLYLTLIRDEVLNIHKVSEDLFDSIKGYVSCTALHCSVLTLICEKIAKVEELKPKKRDDECRITLLL